MIKVTKAHCTLVVAFLIACCSVLYATSPALAQSVPTITSISPTSTTVGVLGTTVTLTGTGYTSTSKVHWNSTVTLLTTYVSATQLTAKVPTTDIKTAGSNSITVVNSAGTSNAVTFTIKAAPTLTSISPTTVRATATSFTLTLKGTNFDSTCVATWLGQDLPTTFVSSTTLTATVAASLVAAAANVPVTAVNSDGIATKSQTFVIAKPPVLQTLSPTSASVGGAAFTLTATGANFASDSQITWNGTALTTKFVSATSLTATVAASLIAAAGSATIQIVDSGDGSSSATQQFLIGSVPTITTIAPKSASTTSKAFTLNVTGTNFLSDLTVQLNGVNLTTKYVSATKLTATVTPAQLTTVGSFPVDVVAPTGLMSNSVTFKVVDSSAPIETSFTPTSVRAGASTFTLTVIGTNFQQGATILWGGTALSTMFISPTQLTTSVPAADVAAPASVAVVVQNPDGSKSGTLLFTVNKAPALLSISPLSVEADLQGFTLTVTGANFASDTTITWNGAVEPTTFVSATTLTTPIPASLVATAGTANVAVIDNDGSAAGPTTFTIRPDPSLTSISPTITPAQSVGFTLTINGANLNGGDIASFGGTNVATTYVSATQMTAFVPSTLLTTAGTYQVTITDPSGIVTNAESFTITPLPVLTSMTPSTVIAGVGTFTLSLTGSAFRSGAVVMWNSTALRTTVVSSTALTATVTAALVAVPGQSSVYVLNSDGTQTTALTFNIDVPQSSATIWNKPLVWAHFLQHYPIDLDAIGQTSIYNNINSSFPLGLAITATDNSPALEIQNAQTAGVDGFDVDIFTVASGIQSYLSAADTVPGFYVAPCLDPTALTGQGATDAQITAAFVQAVTDYVNLAATHVSAARDNNNLVIYTFGVNLIPLTDWQAARTQLIANGITNTTWVGDLSFTFNTPNLFPQTAILADMGVFEAGYVWLGAHATYWPQLQQLLQLDDQNFAGGVMAGNDLTTANYVDDLGTQTIRNDWQKNLNNPGQWAQVSTWNAYLADNLITPSSDWDYTRSDLNEWYSAAFKGAAAPFTDARAYVTSPKAVDLGQSEVAEALVINPTNAAVTVQLRLFDGNGTILQAPVIVTIAAKSIGTATATVDFTTQPAKGFFRASVKLLNAAGATLTSGSGAPCIVYASGVNPGVQAIYYSVPTKHSLAGTVRLAITAGTGSTGTAAITIPSGTTVGTVDLLYNTGEVINFVNIPPYSTTVSTAGPGYYVARVIDVNGNVSYSDAVYVGP